MDNVRVDGPAHSSTADDSLPQKERKKDWVRISAESSLITISPTTQSVEGLIWLDLTSTYRKLALFNYSEKFISLQRQ